jgi:hypothetical protein
MTTRYFPTGDESEESLNGLSVDEQFDYITEIIMNDICEGKQLLAKFGVDWLRKVYKRDGYSCIKKQIDRASKAYKERFGEDP